MGSSAPRVPSVDFARAIHRQGTSFSLLCLAQAYPLPQFRQVLDLIVSIVTSMFSRGLIQGQFFQTSEYVFFICEF